MIPRTLVLLIITITLASSQLINQFLSNMPTHPNEMDKTILQEFVSEGVTANDMDQMNEKYKVFRREWIDRMVEYMLQELNLNEEGAREARKHPEDFHINYDTYKLFVSSQSL